MTTTMIAPSERDRRSRWIQEIGGLSNDFATGAAWIEQSLSEELRREGTAPLLSHLRLCGAIPEVYAHDSTQEKLYSKYTDVVIHQAYSTIGLTSSVLRERADVADVECACPDYSFVADAKAFRLSRTAKNQKDFKIQAMDNWKHGLPFAMVVCPVYQLPRRSSQIYQQAVARSVCIFTYTHLAVLVRYAEIKGQERAMSILHNVFKAVEALNPSKEALSYWRSVNETILEADLNISPLWREEKVASVESVGIAKEEALTYLASERNRIMLLSRDEAIQEVIQRSNLDNRIRAVQSVSDNGLMEIG